MTSLIKRWNRKHISAVIFSNRCRWYNRWWVELRRCQSNSPWIRTESFSNLFHKFSNNKLPLKIWAILTSNKLCKWWTAGKLISPSHSQKRRSQRSSMILTSSSVTRLACWTRWSGSSPPSKASKKTQFPNSWPSWTRKLPPTAVFYSEINKK